MAGYCSATLSSSNHYKRLRLFVLLNLVLLWWFTDDCMNVCTHSYPIVVFVVLGFVLMWETEMGREGDLRVVYHAGGKSYKLRIDTTLV